MKHAYALQLAVCSFIVVWAILAFLEPQAAAHFPEIQEALEILVSVVCK